MLTLTLFYRPISLIVEPILREPGSVAFSWMEIQRTKASIVQVLDMQTNYTDNITLTEFKMYPHDRECEHRCPEIDACIEASLWCNGECS